MRKHISTNTPSEERVGYSRAIKIGNRIYFSGTTSISDTGETEGDTLYDQTVYCITKIKDILEKEGFSLTNVILLRAYIIDMRTVGEFDRAFSEYFKDIKPCCTLLGVRELMKPDLLIEIEIEAEIDPPQNLLA